MKRLLWLVVGLALVGVGVFVVLARREAPAPPHPEIDEASRERLLEVLREEEP